MNYLKKILIKNKLLLECPICKSAFPITNQQLERTTTRCKACRSTFEYADQLAAAGLPVSNSGQPDFIPIQTGMEMRKSKDKLEIVMRTKELTNPGTIGLAILINLFLLYYTYAVFTQKADIAFLYLIILIPAFIVAIILFFKSLMHWLNSTHITVDKAKIVVKHSSTTSSNYQDRQIMTDTIETLLVREHVEEVRNENTVSYIESWSIDIKMKNGEDFTMIEDLKYEEDARLIEQQIKKHLSVQDYLELKELSDSEAVKIHLPGTKPMEGPSD